MTSFSFFEIARAYFKILHRIPTILFIGLKVLFLKDDDCMSWGKLIQINAEKFPDNSAIKFEEETLSYKQFNEITNCYANYFLDNGVKKGDVVTVFMQNRLELLILYTAISKIGAISSLVNPNQRAKGLEHCLNLVTSDVLIYGEEVKPSLDEVRQSIAFNEIYCVSEDSKQVSTSSDLDLKTLISSYSSENLAITDTIQLKEPLAYVFTSGTTGGMPKAAIITNRRIYAASLWFGGIVQRTRPKDVVYCPLPFFHTNGLSVAWPASVANGAALAFRRKFSTSQFLDDVRKFKATIFIYIGELPRYLMNSQAGPDDHDNPLQKVIGNGLRPDIWHEFKQRYGISKIYEFYGAAESIWIFTNFLNLNNTVGINLQKFAVVKCDPITGEPVRSNRGKLEKVKKGETGLLIFKTSQSYKFAGYTDKKESKKKLLIDCFRSGDQWFNTGDLVGNLGYRHVRFVDRVGDTFRFKGENVSTTEVENVVNSYPGIIGSAAYGAALPSTDGRVGIVSILSEESTDKFDFSSFFEFLHNKLPEYAVPRFLRFESEFCTTTTHKIQKVQLKTEGIDVNKIDCPLFYLSESTFRPMTQEVYAKIMKGTMRF